MAVNPLRRTLDFLAKMGLTVRDDPPRVIDTAARDWGDPVEGLRLSIEQIRETLSVVLRNEGTYSGTLWYTIETEAPLTPFGRRHLEHNPAFMNPITSPGQLTEAQIPLGSLFDLSAPYRIQVAATLPDGRTLRSNAR